MKLTLAIPIYNELQDTKGQWAYHIALIGDRANTELLVIDNGSSDGSADWIEEVVFPHFPDHRMIRHTENQGVIASMNEIVQEAKGDVIAILHNDVYILEVGWDQRVLKEFEDDHKLGLAGFLGAEGIHNNGGRMNTVSNMLEAEMHGMRDTGVRNVAVMDGFSLIGRKEMFEKVGGFDTGFTFHHYYDKSISIDSLLAGYTNKMIGVYCHHRSGVTANRPAYQTWIDKKMGTTNFTGDKASYDASERHFFEKYAAHLPIMVR